MKMDLKDKIVTVVGLGNSGVNAAILLNSLGARVRVTDSQDTPAIRDSAMSLKNRGIEVETGAHTKKFIDGSALIIVSPGVEDTSPAMKWANELKIPMISEMELGFRFCKGKIIAITGTNGKSTVTSLIGEILKDAGFHAIVCGNIGNSLCGEISRIRSDTWVVLETSSFQLERTREFKPAIALILNITDDHMDRYKKFSDYFNEKLKIFRNQDKNDILILNYDAANLRALASRSRSRALFYSRVKKTGGAYCENGRIFCVSDGATRAICVLGDIGLRGAHNVENVLASSLVGTITGARADSIRNTIRRFKTLPHRFETVDTIDGVDYIDDSKGTTVDSTYRALESCDRPVILIAGGKDKHSDYAYVRDVVRKKVRHLVLIGEATEAIKRALQDIVPIETASDMSDAVERAHRLARRDFLVLLSPMCSSFDMFKDYKERGEAFKNAVRGIKDGLVKEMKR